jgi:hypothetical protein
VTAAAPSTIATTAPGTAQRNAGWVVDMAMGGLPSVIAFRLCW